MTPRQALFAFGLGSLAFAGHWYRYCDTPERGRWLRHDQTTGWWLTFAGALLLAIGLLALSLGWPFGS